MKTYTKIAAVLLVAVMFMTFVAPVANAKPGDIPPGQLKKLTGIPPGQLKKIGFLDVDDTVEWARLAIDRMYARGIFTGYPGDIFKPKNNVTHLEAIIMSLRVMGWEEEAKKIKIDDYIKKINLSWNDAYYYVALAVEKGLIKPEELKGFNPNTPAKRYEVARYIVRALDMESEAKKHMKKKLSFKDASAIPKDAVGYVYVMLDLELMKGDNNNKFKPNEPISRAEMAVMLNRLDGSLEPEEENQFVGTIYKIDIDDLTITLENSSGRKTYDILKKAPVYVNGKYRGLEELKTGDKVELVLDSDKYVVFIQLLEKTERKTTTTKGLVVDVNPTKKAVTLFTYGKYQEGLVGTLKVSKIEGRHYELETEKGRYVLVGDETDDLEDYVGEVIVVFGEISRGMSIYMRGPLIEVEKFYPVTSKYTTTFYIDSDTKITVDDKRAGLLNIKAGDYAQVKAQDELAVEIKVETTEEPKNAIITARGLVAEVNERKRTISLVTYIKTDEESYVGTLKENNIEGIHYELETEQGIFVLKGNIKGIEDYIGEKIVVKGELKDEVSIFMRGYFLDVDDYYLLRTRDFVTFDVDDSTLITVDGVKLKLSGIEAGDYAVVHADEDNFAVEIKVNSCEKRIKDWERERKTIRDGKLEGKVISISFGKEWQLTIQNDDEKFTLVIDKDVEIEGLKSLRHIKKGMELEFEIKDGKIIEIEVDD
ncbi:MAG: S-layer homology domain-containing protein [Tepidanaerobacteraceae bacterium]|nr:S-layer homology domain-containing protein [Tepidanaerobacteraceae bacterium]